MASSDKVRAKKWLGQHFLTSQPVADRIVGLLQRSELPVIETGPGMGVLTTRLVARGLNLTAVEVDDESVAWLARELPQVRVIHASILECDLPPGSQAWIGNLPYNLSSPILFRMLELRAQVQEGVFMLQREVARRIAAPPDNKEYGILSVLLQYYYEVQYAFTVPPGAFSPPPKVHSGVIRLVRRRQADELALAPLAQVVKTAFNQRRKMLGNAVKSLPLELPEGWAARRPEQLSVAEFALLARQLA
ncbi:MAG: ribosomal RNA small subunit methyltransferase A [Bacteroidetes bacterium]|nr:ribosomal RNA small subunit methyltransferase A [Bacteroidota bacterium]